ncbi:MAG: SDR family NAD(P)-dependent oxidoreductase [Herminiimonas sp.]|nr:SDR family NAD(P)-dependent oxidoreductase [Herminiimonas sp.]
MQAKRLIHDWDHPVNALVVGATGGIGLALVRQMLDAPQVERLFAVARTTSSNPDLLMLAVQHAGRLTLLDCDIREEAALAHLASSIKASVPALHLVINTAGILHEGARMPEKSLASVTLAGLQHAFAINAFAPILLAKALLPLLRHTEPAIFASLSARVGSISDNRTGGWYGYRAAKAAQNQLLKTLALELTRLNRRSIVVALHPGTTDTALSRPFQANVAAGKLFTADFSAAALLQVLAQRSPADSGGFYAWDGSTIGW